LRDGLYGVRLAKRYNIDVVAVDLGPQILRWASQRIDKEGVGEEVTLQAADAHALRFPTNTSDAVLTEAVLVFCDAKRHASEMYRVLKPGGRSGSKEQTLLKPLPTRSGEALEEVGIEVSFLSEQGN
jgi:ubiquinone/menaquinone biosynthesis C-methylase UbiE